MTLFSRALTDPLQGRTPLRRVFWVHGVGVSVVYSLLGLLVDPLSVTSVRVYTVLGAAIGVVQSVMLWKCAYNTRSRALGHWVRISVVAVSFKIKMLMSLMYSYALQLLDSRAVGCGDDVWRCWGGRVA
jgi:hypothetical protein